MAETKQKSIKLPKELAERIEKDAKENHRDFTKQIIHIITQYYKLQDEK